MITTPGRTIQVHTNVRFTGKKDDSGFSYPTAKEPRIIFPDRNTVHGKPIIKPYKNMFAMNR